MLVQLAEQIDIGGRSLPQQRQPGRCDDLVAGANGIPTLEHHLVVLEHEDAMGGGHPHRATVGRPHFVKWLLHRRAGSRYGSA